MKTKFICFFMAILTLCSCSKMKLKKEVEQLFGREVLFPPSMETYLLGKNSVDVDFSQAVLKLVVFYDSLDCMSCRVSKLETWNKIVEFAIETDYYFKPIFIFSPGENNKRDLYNLLKTTAFNYPLNVDTSGYFTLLNSYLVKYDSFHTFLIDKDNHIILVGDPVKNESIWELYQSTINNAQMRN